MVHPTVPVLGCRPFGNPDNHAWAAGFASHRAIDQENKEMSRRPGQFTSAFANGLWPDTLGIRAHYWLALDLVTFFFGVFTITLSILTDEPLKYWRLTSLIACVVLSVYSAYWRLGKIGRHLPPGTLLFKYSTLLGRLLRRDTREHFDLLVADLRRERKSMLARRMNPCYIRLWLYWGAVSSVIPVTIRALLALLAIEQLIRKFRK